MSKKTNAKNLILEQEAEAGYQHPTSRRDQLKHKSNILCAFISSMTRAANSEIYILSKVKRRWCVVTCPRLLNLTPSRGRQSLQIPEKPFLRETWDESKVAFEDL